MEVFFEVGFEGEEERFLLGGWIEEEDRIQSGFLEEGRGIFGIKVLDVIYFLFFKVSQDSSFLDFLGLVNYRFLDIKDMVFLVGVYLDMFN